MPTILLVEDASEPAQVILRELEAAGYEVLHAGDGLTALQLRAGYQPDLMILDWVHDMLEDNSLYACCRAIGDSNSQ